MTIYLSKEAELEARCTWLTNIIVDLKKELLYHEMYQLSGDGQRCEECEKVRYVDDCIKVGDFYACSERCAGKLERDAEGMGPVDRPHDLPAQIIPIHSTRGTHKYGR